MCQKTQLLAKISQNKRLLRCEHGTIHLIFKQVHCCFSEAWLTGMQNQQSLTYDQQGDHYLCWFDQVALKVSYVEFMELTQLVLSAHLPLAQGQDSQAASAHLH